MNEVIAKYDEIAERYSAQDYADAERYYERRAQLIARALHPGATLLDIACGDGGLGRHLARFGIDYRGVDASARMIEIAQRSLGGRVEVAGFEYVPPDTVDATTIFRSLYLVPDRRVFLTRVRSYTRARLIFDFDPRAYDVRELLDDVHAAGWEHVSLRPFLHPQRSTLPRAVQGLLHALEPVPGARILTKVRFPLFVTAS